MGQVLCLVAGEWCCWERLVMRLRGPVGLWGGEVVRWEALVVVVMVTVVLNGLYRGLDWD